MERILVPLDGSHLAEAAVPIAARLADACGSAITLLHVIEKDAPSSIHGEPHLANGAEAGPYLARLTHQLAADGRTVDYHVHEAPVGDVARSIASHAEELGSDLVVVSTHGRRRHPAWALGLHRPACAAAQPPTSIARADASGRRRCPRRSPRQRSWSRSTAPWRLRPRCHWPERSPAHWTRACASSWWCRRWRPSPGEHQPKATFLPGTTRMLLDVREEQATAYLEQLAAYLRIDRECRPSPKSAAAPRWRNWRPTPPSTPTAWWWPLRTGGRGLQAIWSTSVAPRGC